MNDKELIISKANQYCEASGLKLSTLGRFIVNDGKFFARLISGGDCGTETKEKIMLWFKNNSPVKKTNNRKK